MKCEMINLEATFGLELESLRVTEDGFLSTDSLLFNDSHISKDFAESQMEFVTDIYDSIPLLYNALAQIYHKADSVLKNTGNKNREYIWPFSVPPCIKPGDDIKIAEFGGADKSREEYRQILAEKYDKKKMLYCGIHFNFSFSDECLRKGFEESNFADFKEYKNGRYVKLAAKTAEYTWLPVLLMGASPVFDISFISDTEYGATMFDNESSRRCGRNGYWNKFEPVLNYSNFNAYIKSIRSMVERGLLCSESELYYPVRLKCHDIYTLDKLYENGTDYIEFRMLDINPLFPYGISKDDLMFLHMFFVYLDTHSETTRGFNKNKQYAAYDKILLAARYKNQKLISSAKEMLYDMKLFFEGVVSDEYMQALCYQIEKLEDENKMYSRIIKEQYGDNLIEKGMDTAKKYSDIIEQNVFI